MRTSGKAAAIFLLLHHHDDYHHQPPLVVLLVLQYSRIAAIEMAKCEFVSGLDSGEACEDEFNDLEKAFDLILEVAMNENLKPEQMIKEVFVLTPHQNYSNNYKRCWESDYEAIQRKFKDKGCGKVHRNWAGVVCSTKQGGVMLQGSSNNLVRCFSNNDGDIGREHVIEPAISDKSIKI